MVGAGSHEVGMEGRKYLNIAVVLLVEVGNFRSSLVGVVVTRKAKEHLLQAA